MAERYYRVTGSPLFDHTYPSPNQIGMVNDTCWQGTTSCPAESSVTNPDMTSQQENIRPLTSAAGTFMIDDSRNAPMTNNHYQQYTPHMSPPRMNAPRPLMGAQVNPPEICQTMPINSVPQITTDNIQAINILQSLLSHLITTSQLSNEHLPIVNRP